MKKKVLSTVLALSMVAGMLVGCGSSASTTTEAPAETTAATEAAATTEAAADAAPAAEAELTFIIASNQTSAENPYHFGLAKFKEVAEAESNGKIEVICHDGTLGENEDELIEKLNMGAAQMVVASPGFMTSIGVPEVDMLSLLYLFDSFDHWEASMDGDFGTAMKDVIMEKTNKDYKVMGYWSSGVRDYYGKKAIKTPADVKGLTIRTQTSGVVNDFWQACGAIPTNVAWGELYQALQQGVVDSAENDYTNLMLKDHHKTDNGHFICETHHDFTTRLFLMDGNYYDSLTDEQKGWIDDAAAAATEAERAKVYEMMDSSKEQCIADGAEVTEFADMDIDAFKAIAIPIQDKFATDNNMTEYLEMVRNAAK
ncbi:MAG: TRAP transporter substrate-binding protein [Lachnospiraceae bacterium]|nr:TRAP transporter substrate-binding protein [Lachnospiraceae bacterium]